MFSIPDRFYEEGIEGGLHDGATVWRETTDRLLTEYYRLMRWDANTGIPTRVKLEELGLGEVADELEALL